MSNQESAPKKFNLFEEAEERVHGSIVGTFTLNRPASRNLERPQEVREAWVGIPLPIREKLASSIADDVHVSFLDAFNALIGNSASKFVLEYWIEQYPSPHDILTFLPDDGVVDMEL